MEDINENVCSGLEAVNIKIVRKREDMDDSNLFFKPEMCHQVFGQSESIYGYKNLKINIMYDACQYLCCITSSYDSKAEPDPVSDLQPEDYMKKINPWLPKDYLTDEIKFLDQVLENSNSIPIGQLVSSFRTINNREFQVRVTDVTAVGYSEFHQRMETLIVWFIDAANFIDIDDKKWRYYILYETVAKNNVENYYYPIGFATVYEYYAFPNHRRYRISQFIVFPPYQHLGLGTELLKSIYKHLHTMPNILDITVEDPSEKFQGLRDFVDAELCRNLPVFNSTALKGEFCKNMVKDARDNFKLNERQIRRVYEILRLSVISTNNEHNSFKQMVKQRLSIPYKKQEKNNKRLKLFHTGKIQMENAVNDDYENSLEKEYQKLVSHYRHVLYRLQQDEPKICSYKKNCYI